MTIIYSQFAFNNLLANHRLLTAAQQLQSGEFAAKGTSFFPSLKATFNHNVTVDWYYVDAMEGGTLGAAAWDPSEPFDNATDLKQAQREVDIRLISICKGLEARQITRLVNLRGMEEPLGNVLVHLFQHQIHHRGQAHAMLAGTSVKPPQLDEFVFRRDILDVKEELAELGFTPEDLPCY